MDVALLMEVVALNPFRNPTKWAEVTDKANQAFQCLREDPEEASVRALQDRVDLLLKHYRQQNWRVLKKCVLRRLCVRM